MSQRVFPWGSGPIPTLLPRRMAQAVHPPPRFPPLPLHLKGDPGFQGRRKEQRGRRERSIDCLDGDTAEGAGGHRWWARWEAADTLGEGCRRGLSRQGATPGGARSQGLTVERLLLPAPPLPWSVRVTLWTLGSCPRGTLTPRNHWAPGTQGPWAAPELSAGGSERGRKAEPEVITAFWKGGV